MPTRYTLPLISVNVVIVFISIYVILLIFVLSLNVNLKSSNVTSPDTSTIYTVGVCDMSSNAFTSMVAESGMVINVKLVPQSKAFSPINITLEGILMEVIEDLRNANSLMVLS